MLRIPIAASGSPTPVLWALALGTLAAVPPALVAQAPIPAETDWNSSEAIELVDRARESRRTLQASGDLQSFRADVEGHVYFFVDPETPLFPTRPLIRVDQVAVEVTWEAPGRLQQHLVGERREERLPVRDFDYYVDRVTLVPYGFEDEIRVGSGQDVARVPHPFSMRDGIIGHYDYRLGDSVTLTLPGAEAPIRVREVVVRPTDRNEPGFVGTIHIDEDTGSIVRMGFTFTPASYVDPRNDRVAVEVEYSLWDRRFWLPSRQRIEVRREPPGFDIGVGTVIRSVLRVGGYELNAPIPDTVRARPNFTALPPANRGAHRFRDGLYDNLLRDGVADVTVDSDIEALRARAMTIMRDASGSGLSSSRLFADGVSSIVRFNRSEGLRIGLGGSVSPSPSTRLRASAGYAFGPGDLQADAVLEIVAGPEWVAGLHASHDRRDDLGLTPGAAGIVSSLAATLGIEDYHDPYVASEFEMFLVRPMSSRPEISFGLGVSRLQSARSARVHAPLDDDQVFRPVRAIVDGDFFVASVGVRTGVPAPMEGRGVVDVKGRALHGQAGSGFGIGLALDQRWTFDDPGQRVELDLDGWIWEGDPLPQGHRLTGGRGTVPGFAFREFAGRRVITSTLLAAQPVSALLSLRAGFHAGWTSDLDPSTATSWDVSEASEVVTAGSVGVGLGWDILRLDLARGFSAGGEWQVILSVDPTWWPWL